MLCTNSAHYRMSGIELSNHACGRFTPKRTALENRFRRQFLDGLVDGENFDSTMFMNHLFSSSKYKGASN